MLSFQVIDVRESLMVYCDSSGLNQLIDILINLRESHDIDHIHMRSPSAGGEILNDQNPWGDSAISEVVISFTK
jgi:hypothetical protein